MDVINNMDPAYITAHILPFLKAQIAELQAKSDNAAIVRELSEIKETARQQLDKLDYYIAQHAADLADLRAIMEKDRAESAEQAARLEAMVQAEERREYLGTTSPKSPFGVTVWIQGSF